MTMVSSQAPKHVSHHGRAVKPWPEQQHEFHRKESQKLEQAIHNSHFRSLHPLKLNHARTLQTSWRNPQRRPIPKWHPMALSNRVIQTKNQCSLMDIITNLKYAFRVMDIQVVYFDDPAGAALLTGELVEAYISLWKTGKNDKDKLEDEEHVCVEVQRRRGDATTFHHYARYILEAASGEFDANNYIKHNGSVIDFGIYNNLNAVEILLPYDMNEIQMQHSLQSVESASRLLQQNRLSARVQGMEYLCILTNPRQANPRTAVLASHAVLFGTNHVQDNTWFSALQRFVLFVVQKRCMADEDVLVKGMVIEYDSDDEGYFYDDDETDLFDEKPAEYVDSMKFMVHFGLIILANALEILTTVDSFFNATETGFVTTAPFTKSYPAVQPEDAIVQFRRIAHDCTQTDILTTLLIDLSRADTNMHNACLAGRCLRMLCQYSKGACSHTKHLNDGLGMVEHAHRVGLSSSATLEKESRLLLQLLSGAEP